MSVRLIGRLFTLLIFAALAFAGYLFVLQNSLRKTGLSLNLGPVGAWKLSQPVPVLALLGAGFAAGFLISAFFFWGRAARLGRRLRIAERQLTTAGLDSGRKGDEWR
jgi:hypothetical protein